MNKSQSVDLKEFGFTPKASLPSISRYKYICKIFIINSLFLLVVIYPEKGGH